MPAPKTTFIPHSCFGYYDEKFIQCIKKCKYSNECKKATNSQKKNQIRKIYKFTTQHIKDLIQQWKE